MKGTFTVSCTIYNGSNILIRPTGKAKIIDSAENEIGAIEINETKTGVFPKTSRVFQASYKGEKLPKGEYFLQLVLDYGGDTYLGGQKSFEIN